MHKALQKSDTSRSALIWPQGTSAEIIEAKQADSAALWIYQNRGTPLEEWGAPKLRINDTVQQNAEAIREFAEIVAAAAAILEAWASNAPEWQTGREYRKLEPGEQLQVGDFVFALGSRHSDQSKISRLTEKTAFTETGRKWPRLIAEHCWHEIGRGPRYSCDVPVRMVEPAKD